MNTKIIALGGLVENGKNCYIVENEKDIIIIDSGSKKFDNRTLGVDTIVNDISYLEKNKDKVKAILISHAHLDQVGGLVFLLEKIKAPIYGSEYTIEFLKNEIKDAEFKVLKDEEVKIGDFTVDSFSLSHSVFGTLGFLIAKGKDAIAYVSDYNFNQSRKEKVRTDIEKIVNLKQKYNIKMLMTESLNADQIGTASSDFSFLEKFNRVAKNVEGKLFISLYSTNLIGMTNIINIAEKNKKKIVIVGKELLTYVNVSKKLGYIDHRYEMFIKTKDIKRYADNEIIVVVSGDFLEPFETLRKMADKNHPITTIKGTDTVMIASEPHDEIEGSVQKILDKVSRTGCKITNIKVNISSHAHQEDIKMMINLFEPENIMPIKGEYRKMEKVREISEYLGYSGSNIWILENGDVLEVKKDKSYVSNHLKLNSKMKNNTLKETVNPLLLSDRESLTSEGYVLITLIVKRGTNKLLQKPEIYSGGLMNFSDDSQMMNKSLEIVKTELKEGITSEGIMKSKNKVRRFLTNKLGKNPTILTVKIEVK